MGSTMPSPELHLLLFPLPCVSLFLSQFIKRPDMGEWFPCKHVARSSPLHQIEGLTPPSITKRYFAPRPRPCPPYADVTRGIFAYTGNIFQGEGKYTFARTSVRLWFLVCMAAPPAPTHCQRAPGRLNSKFIGEITLPIGRTATRKYIYGQV